MIHITRNDEVVVKKSLTKTNNINKSNKEPKPSITKELNQEQN